MANNLRINRFYYFLFVLRAIGVAIEKNIQGGIIFGFANLRPNADQRCKQIIFSYRTPEYENHPSQKPESLVLSKILLIF